MDMILLILVLIVLASLLYSRRTSRRSGNYRSRWTQPQDTTTQEQTSASIASQVDTDTLSYDKAYHEREGVLSAIMQFCGKEKHDSLYKGAAAGLVRAGEEPAKIQDIFLQGAGKAR